jgi:hypothetical protein
MITIEQIKSALQAHITEAEAATPGPWIAWQENEEIGTNYVRIRTSNDTHLRDTLHGYCGEANATFIAHARTMSPTACKCLLLAIEGLKGIAETTTPVSHGCDSEGEAYISNFPTSEASCARARLELIRREWSNLIKE